MKRFPFDTAQENWNNQNSSSLTTGGYLRIEKLF